MADLQWLDSYSGQTLDELLALTDEYRVDSLVVALEQALATEGSQSRRREPVRSKRPSFSRSKLSSAR